MNSQLKRKGSAGKMPQYASGEKIVVNGSWLKKFYLHYKK